MAYNEADKCWHILITTEGGTVSILQNLDAPTARQAYHSLDPWANVYAQSGGMRMIQKSDVRSLKILGPEGEKLFLTPASCDTHLEGGDAQQGSVHG